MKSLRKNLSRWLLVTLWAAFIFLLSSSSDPYGLMPERLFHWIYVTHIHGIRLTKIVGPLGHMMQFGILALLLARALTWKVRLTWGHILLAFALSLLYALSDEIHQFFVPQRAFQLFDLLIDGVGVMLGLVIYMLWRKIASSSWLVIHCPHSGYTPDATLMVLWGKLVGEKS